MTSLLFTAGAAGLGLGAAGQFGAAIAGSLIDNFVIFPELFPAEQSNRSPQFRLDNNVETGVEGTIARYPMGSAVRLPAFTFWAGPRGARGEPTFILEQFRPQHHAPLQNRYLIHLACAATIGKEIVRFRKIWADGKLLYDDDTNPTVTSSLIDAVVLPVYVNAIGGGVVVNANLNALVLVSPSTGPDIQTPFNTGEPITVSGFTSPATANNQDWDVLLALRDFNIPGAAAPPNTVLVLVDALAPITEPVAKAAADSITLEQTRPAFSSQRFNDIRFYTGTSTQPVDPLILALQNTNGVPAFRNVPYFVIERLDLTNFGNRIPSLQCLVEADSDPYTYGDAIAEQIGRSNVESSLFDVSAITEALEGTFTDGPQAPTRSLQPLLLAGDVIGQDINGVLTFKTRQNSDTIVISDGGELAAHEIDERASRPVEVLDKPFHDTPSKVTVQYIDSVNGYQRSAQSARIINPETERHVGVNVPIIMTGKKARETAKRKLRSDQKGAQSITAFLPPSYQEVIEGDRLTFPAFNRTLTIIIEEVNEGVNGVRECVGYLDEIGLSTQVDEELPIIPEDIILGNPFIQMEIMDLPALEDAQLGIRGFYLAGALWDTRAQWEGAELWESIDNVNYVQVGSIQHECVMGSTDPEIWERFDASDLDFQTTGDIIDRTAAGGSWLTDGYAIGDLVGVLNSTGNDDEYEIVSLTATDMGVSPALTTNGVDTNQVQVYKYGLGVSGAGTPEEQTAPNSGLPVLWDTKHTFRVQLIHGDLNNKTRSQVLQGENMALVGDEIVGFTTATLIQDNIWECSDLLRGRFNTELQRTGHGLVPKERFVLLDLNAIQFHNLSEYNHGAQFYYKAVPAGQDITQVGAQTFTLIKSPNQPWAPAKVTGTKETNDDITVTWVPRSRANFRVFGSVIPPQLEEQYWFIVEFFLEGEDPFDPDALSRLVLYDDSISPGSFSVTYTAAQQTNDGWTPASDTIPFRIYQIKDGIVTNKGGEGTFSSVVYVAP